MNAKSQLAQQRGHDHAYFTVKYHMLGSRTLYFTTSASRFSYELRSWIDRFWHAIDCQRNSIRFNVNLALSLVAEGQVRRTRVCMSIPSSTLPAQLNSARCRDRITVLSS